MAVCFTCNKVADDHCVTNYDGKHFHQGTCLQGYIDRKNISAETFKLLDSFSRNGATTPGSWPITMPSVDKIWN